MPILTREQCPIPNLVRDCIGTPLGSNANTNGDMLETMVDLYRVSPDEEVKARLLEMLQRYARHHGGTARCCAHVFQPNWTPVPDIARYSYGINTSNILAKASPSPCLEADTKTGDVRQIRGGHGFAVWLGASRGGFFYGGSTFGPTHLEDIVVFIDTKFWWPQAEGMRALLRMALLFRTTNETTGSVSTNCGPTSRNTSLTRGGEDGCGLEKTRDRGGGGRRRPRRGKSHRTKCILCWNASRLLRS